MNPNATPRLLQSKEKSLHNPPVYRPGKVDAAQQTARPALAAPPVYNPWSTAGTPPGHGSITPPVFGPRRINTPQPAQALVKGPVCPPVLSVAVQPKIMLPPAPNRSVLFSIPRMNQLPKPPLPAFSTDSAIQLMKKNKKNKLEEKWQKLSTRAEKYGASQDTHDWLRVAKALGMAPANPDHVFGHGSGNKNSGGPKKSAQQALSKWIKQIKAQAVLKLKMHDLDPTLTKIKSALKM